MQHLVFEFQDEQQMRTIVQRLWEGIGVSGELDVRPIKDGKWRCQIYSEKDLKESVLGQFAEFRVEAGD
ncbi:MAG TPA: hypothetical protein VK191_17425 [Symbiobacteriaceae bacterium]|nr:hypothetical protein [Symbiobacteriaceae bacterium]